MGEDHGGGPDELVQATLWFDSDRGAVGNHTRNLPNLWIRHGHASIGPIDKGVQPTNESDPVLHSVNHDKPARFDARGSSGLDVGSRWIGDVQGAMKVAVAQAIVDDVVSFRGAAVAILPLGTNGVVPQRDSVRFQQLSPAIETEVALGLPQNDTIRASIVRQR